VIIQNIDKGTKFRKVTDLPVQLQTRPSGSVLVQFLPWKSFLYFPGTCNKYAPKWLMFLSQLLQLRKEAAVFCEMLISIHPEDIKQIPVSFWLKELPLNHAISHSFLVQFFTSKILLKSITLT
jgi:hypothetical protein